MVTLLQLRTRVKQRYERSGSSNDASTALLDMFVNDALREANNLVGDDAYYLRSSEVMTIAAFPATNTMPEYVRRIYRIEDEVFAPGTPIGWDFVRHEGDGRAIIVVQRGGSFTVQYLRRQIALVNDGDDSPVPDEHIEAIVAMACRRLAHAIGNDTFARVMDGDAESLIRTFKRDCLKYGGMRHETLRSKWRTP